MLIQAFKKNTDWSKEEVAELSKNSGLTESQVYKWAWDQKKKLQTTQTNYQTNLTKSVDSEKDKKQTKKIEDQSDKQIDSAEVIRDEFGGYCCKRWGADKDDKNEIEEDLDSEENIWKLLGLDIEKQALEIVKEDFKRLKIPFNSASKAGSLQSSASKSHRSINLSACKSMHPPSTAATNSNQKILGTCTPNNKFNRTLTPSKLEDSDSNQ